MSDNRAIGVFDSGLGGLTVVRELVKQLPFEDIVYFGDTGRVPYGTRSRDTIRKYALQDEKFLLSHNVKLVVAACGTVSSVAADTGDNLPVPFIEVVSNSVRAAVKATKNKRIGILGTAATVNSGEHKRQILKLLPDALVSQNAASLFVPLVEEGWYKADDTVVLNTVERYLKPLLEEGVDTLILGCTHFPVLEEAIAKVAGNGVTLINMGEETAISVKNYLSQNGALCENSEKGKIDFYVSDKAESFRKTASVLLGEEIDDKKVKQVNIGKYDEGCNN